MSLMVCPECGHSISDKAEFCLYCGYPLAGAKPPKPLKIISNSYFGKLAQGEYTLPITFWHCFFLAFFAVNMLIYAFSWLLIPLFMPPSSETIAAAVAIFLIYAAYLLLCAVGVWRSAARYTGARQLAFAARIFVVCYAVSSLYLTISGFIIPLLKLAKLTN